MLPKSRTDALIALEWNPKVMAALVGDRPADDPFWDFQPYPDRFSIRFVLAHLADWDPVSQSRIERIAKFDNPELPALDEVQMAEDNGYKSQNPIDNLHKWAEDRKTLINYFLSIPQTDHKKVGLRVTHGWISIEDYPALIVLHDGYHISQTVDYMERWKRR